MLYALLLKCVLELTSHVRAILCLVQRIGKLVSDRLVLDGEVATLYESVIIVSNALGDAAKQRVRAAHHWVELRLEKTNNNNNKQASRQFDVHCFVC